MDTGDVDRDGDEDIMPGSLPFKVAPPSGLLAQWVAQGVPYVVLKNAVR